MRFEELNSDELNLVAGGGIVVSSRSEAEESRGVIVSGEDGEGDSTRGVIFGD